MWSFGNKDRHARSRGEANPFPQDNPSNDKVQHARIISPVLLFVLRGDRVHPRAPGTVAAEGAGKIHLVDAVSSLASVEIHR